MLSARIFRYFPPLFLRLSNIGAKSHSVNDSVRFPIISTLDIKGIVPTRTFLTAKVSSYRMGVIAEQETPVLQFTKVLPEASAPVRGSEKAAGYDLKSAVDIVVPARGKALVDTGLKIALPQGCYGRIAPRSGLAVKNFIDVGAGVVDEDYRGVLKVVLFNHSDTDFKVTKGDRIAQLICERIYYPQLQEVKDLDDTTRGEGGFGSTGTN